MIDRLGTAIAGAVAVFFAAVTLYLYLDRQNALRSVSEAQRVLAEERGAWTTERQRLTEAALMESERARQVESQWREKQREVTSNAQEQVRAAAADAARARSAADVLRKRAEALASQCAPYGDEATRDPAAAFGGAAAENPGVVLADLLGRLAKTAGELAAIADARGSAGAACEKAYGVLK
jgi:hypothetical protein